MRLSLVILIALVSMMSMATKANAEIRTQSVEYKQGDTVCEGYLAYDDSLTKPVPGVLVVHEWYGLNDYAKMRAEMLAKLGYVAFCADIYGKGNRAKNNDEAGKLASIYRNDRKLMRERAIAALDVLKMNKMVDPNRIAAIGYCFGGTTVLELARSGAKLNGVVSFHGGLDTPDPKATNDIKAKVLVLHGSDDPNLANDQLKILEDELRNAKADWEIVLYGGAVHSFSNPASGNDPSRGVAYNEKADKRSWRAMQDFFNEIFAK